jgi:YkoP domain
MDLTTPIEPARPGRPRFARAVLGFDRWLRCINGVYEYSTHPHCAFRIMITRAGREISLPGGTRLHAEDRIIELHIWNEQFPCFPEDGATLGWGRQVSRRVDISLRELARYLAAAPDLADIRAIRADTRLAGPATTAQLLRICRRYGLERAPIPANPRCSNGAVCWARTSSLRS